MYDIQIDPQGDIALNSLGDLSLIGSPHRINSSLIRRLSTTLSGYTRVVKSQSSYVEVDSDYGSLLYDFLSMPLNELNTEEIEKAVIESVSKEPGLVLQDIAIGQDGYDHITILITYLDENNKIQTLEI